MEYGFDPKRCPAEYYRPKFGQAHTDRFLAWPAYVYKVQAPKPQPRKIDIFKKAVLGCYRIKSYTFEEIAGYLKLHPELVALIYSQLLNSKYIDTHGKLTEQGSQLLKEEDTHEDCDPDHFVTGFIYQDPWTQRFWPRFKEQPQTVELILSQDSSEFPKIEVGTRGEPKPQRVFWVCPEPDEILPRTPEPHDILQVIQKHSRALKNIQRVEKDREMEENRSLQAPPSDLEKITLIEDIPKQVFLVTRVYIPKEDAISEDSWLVCDPFGLGESFWLREMIQKRREKNKGLDHELKRMFEPLKEKYAKDACELFEVVNSLAEEEIERHLTFTIRSSELFELLLKMERMYQEVLFQKENLSEEKLQNVLIQAQNVLERMFYILWQANKEVYKNATALLTDDKDSNQNILNATAESIGVKIPLPDSIVRIHKGKIEWFAKTGSESLGARIAASLLAAYHNQNHPFALMLREEPGLIHDLDTIATLRNKKAAHDNPKEKLSFEEVTIVRSHVFEALTLFQKHFSV